MVAVCSACQVYGGEGTLEHEVCFDPTQVSVCAAENNWWVETNATGGLGYWGVRPKKKKDRAVDHFSRPLPTFVGGHCHKS